MERAHGQRALDSGLEIKKLPLKKYKGSQVNNQLTKQLTNQATKQLKKIIFFQRTSLLVHQYFFQQFLQPDSQFFDLL